MTTLNIRLFGRFQVVRGGRAMPGFEVRKVQELFSYLLLNRRRSHSREMLATLLWADYRTSQARRYLSKALWQLQSALSKTSASTAGCMLLCNSDWIELNSQTTLKLDVADFENGVAQANGVPGRSLDPVAAQALNNALNAYQGELLEGCYEDWCLCERERLQMLYMNTLDKLIHYCAAQGDYEAGLEYGFRILASDRARERTHRQLMHLHYRAGDRTSALRQYERCKAVLHEELGVAPSHSTQLLYQQIRSDHLPLPTPEPPIPAEWIPTQAGTDPLQQMLVEVRRVQAAASEVEQILQEQIATGKS